MARLSFLPLAAALLLHPSLERTAETVDRPDTACHGAPLIWNCDGVAASMSHDFFVGPLLLDAAIILAIAAGTVWILKLALRGWLKPVRVLTTVFFWLWGGLSAYMTVFFLTHDAGYSAWMPDHYSPGWEARIGFAF